MSRINAALHIVKDWLQRRVPCRRRPLRGADPIVPQGSLRKERGFHRFWGHYCCMTSKPLKIKEIRSVQHWKDQQLVIEDIMRLEVSRYKLRLEKTEKIEAI